MNNFSRFFFNDEGVTAIEYAMIAVLIAAAIVVAVETVGTNTSALFDTIASAL